ncbi:SDR family NAD(P)-dependent oxidoreductase [Micromonospora eburnea]|uniref:NAD(P)-dependent dehydrogenase, short-chain alcohol dehydrogenase family n=1 Tax=Micromonospora eburnea TaxID=227316 RepID=A0A1C6UU45_9ACTN|nr:SDR family oxidoreductase [Micromonospora eburnea]SCL57604.1 NAD(P)-dependent dehydrogenase, short-chain alcohol dehydrogenase family [Micromonospora eburnea]
MAEFDGRTVLITGGGSGIGLATARRLLEVGARVVIAGRSVARLHRALEALDAPERVVAVPADVSVAADLDRLMTVVEHRVGRLHGVFANAGIARFNPCAAVADEEYADLLDTNLRGVFHTIQKALPLLVDGAAVVVNGSWLVHRGLATTPLYAAGKAAVVNLARSLAADLGARGTRINAVSPGYIVTDMFLGIADTEESREAARGQVPLGRLGRPEDVADAVVFLLSDRSSYITGQELLVDGGLITSVPK